MRLGKTKLGIAIDINLAEGPLEEPNLQQAKSLSSNLPYHNARRTCEVTADHGLFDYYPSPTKLSRKSVRIRVTRPSIDSRLVSVTLVYVLHDEQMPDHITRHAAPAPCEV